MRYCIYQDLGSPAFSIRRYSELSRPSTMRPSLSMKNNKMMCLVDENKMFTSHLSVRAFLPLRPRSLTGCHSCQEWRATWSLVCCDFIWCLSMHPYSLVCYTPSAWSMAKVPLWTSGTCGAQLSSHPLTLPLSTPITFLVHSPHYLTLTGFNGALFRLFVSLVRKSVINNLVFTIFNQVFLNRDK